MNEIMQHKEELPIIMKSGLVHWVSRRTWDTISQMLATQTAHGFIRIQELGNININSSEIEGAYTRTQYDDLCNVKQGLWQCTYKKWHAKGKKECECHREFMKRQAEERRQKEEAIQNRQLSPEEHARQVEAMTTSNEIWALDGNTLGRSMYQVGNKAGRVIRRKTIKEWEKKTGKKANLEGIAIEILSK